MTREEWLSAAVEELRPVFDSLNPLPEKIRVTCGFPSVRSTALKKRIGEHWSPKASEDQTHEILISPVLDDSVEVFAVLVHELAHAATDGDGHQGRFPATVRSLSLEGKPSQTYAGDAFKQRFKDLIDGLGPYLAGLAQKTEHPHAEGGLPRLWLHRAADLQVACGGSAHLPRGPH